MGCNLFTYTGNLPTARVDCDGADFLDFLSNSVTSFCNGVSNVIDFVFPGSKERVDKIMNMGSYSFGENVYNVGNWLTMGFFDSVKGAFTPEKPLSVDHWLASADVFVTSVFWGSAAYKNILKNQVTDPVVEALKTLNKTSLRPGQTVLSKSKVLSIANDFNSQLAQSSIYSANGLRYVVDGHHTTVASIIAGIGTTMNMGLPTTQLPSAQDIYWWKHWWEFWKKSIKLIK